LPAKAGEDDKLTSLIELQCSDGHFKWGEVLASLTGKNKKDLSAERPSFAGSGSGGSGVDVNWLTAIAIVLLEAMTAEKELWELVVQKAKKFLAKTLAEEDVAKLLLDAAKQI
jgi:hypothetical protein